MCIVGWFGLVCVCLCVLFACCSMAGWFAVGCVVWLARVVGLCGRVGWLLCVVGWCVCCVVGVFGWFVRLFSCVVVLLGWRGVVWFALVQFGWLYRVALVRIGCCSGL